MVDKALASQFVGEGSNPAETCGQAAGSYFSVLPKFMGEPAQFVVHCIVISCSLNKRYVGCSVV